MSKISELSDGGSLQSTDYLIAVRSGGNVKVRPNGAVSGTTGQFSTSLNVDGTVTADGLTVSTTTGSSSITPTDITIKTETSASDWSTTDEWGRLVFYSDDVSNGGAKAHATIGVSPTASGGGLSKLVFKTSNSTPSLVKRMDIDEVGDISFYEDTGTTPKFFWDASAEALGIGTTSPSAPLDVHGSAALVANINGTNANGGYVRFQNSGTSIGDIGAGAQVFGGGTAGDFGITSRSGNLVFGTGTTERARIDSSGAFLVGTTTSAGAGGVGLTGQFRAGYQGVLNGFGNEDFSGLFYSGGASNGFTAINSSSGNIPLYISLSSSATTGSLINFADTGSNVGTISTNGTTTSYNTSSDARLKHDIVDAPDASNLIDAIKVRSFKWNVDNSEQRYGMVAQELLEVAPEAVSQGATEDDMMGVDYSKLVPMLVKEIQSLRARVAQLEGA